MRYPKAEHGEMDAGSPYIRVGPWKVIEYQYIHDVSLSYQRIVVFEMPYGADRDNPQWRVKSQSNCKPLPPEAMELFDFAKELVKNPLPVQLVMHALVAKIQSLLAAQPGE